MIGQCPSFDSLENDQLSWMFIWDDKNQYEWARMITHQQKDVTTTLKFRFPCGSNAFDETSITRLFPELMADILEAYSPEIDMSVVYNSSFGIESDGQLGGSAPGNDPRMDAAFRWITVGRGDKLAQAQGPRGTPRHMKNQRGLSAKAASENRFASLPCDPDVKERLGEAAIQAGSLTESAKLHSAVPALKRDPRQAEEIKKREMTEDEMMNQAIKENEAIRARSELTVAPPERPGDEHKRQVSYATAALEGDRVDKVNTSSKQALELQRAKKLQQIAQMGREGDTIKQAVEDGLPTKYKTDNDTTSDLQEEMRLKKMGSRHLN
jgi:hypothetical protein